MIYRFIINLHLPLSAQVLNGYQEGYRGEWGICNIILPPKKAFKCDYFVIIIIIIMRIFHVNDI